jgi:putrescine aminotransferase
MEEIPMQQPYPDRAATVAAFADRVDRGKATLLSSFGADIVMGERAGVFFHDAFDGRRYFNCHCNGGVFNLGHRNPRVVAALQEAMGSVDIGNDHLVSGWRAKLAERLAATTGGRLPSVVFGVGGGEIVDVALKVARARTGRTGVLSAVGGYHGHTGLAMASGDAQYRDPFGPNLPGFKQVPFNDLAALDAALDDTTAAVLLEPIPATLGMPIPEPGYLAGVQALCRERGALFVLDEVQTGLGRTGTVWYHEQEGLEPDVVLTAKGLSGGLLPITAALMTREAHAVFDEHPFVHVSTFGGAELGCVAALTVLDILEQPGFLERVRTLGEAFEEGLAGLPYTLRRRGLFMGLKSDEPYGGVAAAGQLIQAGVFAVFANNDPSVLQLLPPLVISDDEVDELLGVVRKALG